ncbi:ABC transporter permease [Ruicaihuangia caeni]|uniref:ABC transporter permease subunit n=1 Tax=Ruicaihuangia caeni TaxID=3042517 RepID=A0AAW6T9X9_9MICO|nr:ABC transporter permease subunit [Klugiella sp. YN-L-19]MDI2099133.1 ABC transporter permease subunit [Klugiella sp. YN-L-19]
MTTTHSILVSRPRARRSSMRRVASAVGRSVRTAIVSIAAVLLLWWAALVVLRVPPFVGKGPIDVWNFLFSGTTAAANQQLVWRALGETMLDALVGFSVGLGAALVLASVFLVFRPVEQALMPIMLILQSIPLIALAPIIILIFGREMLTVAVMGGLVVVFPALVTIVFGLRSTSKYMIELIDVYGGSTRDVLFRVAIPSAVPALFAAVRIAIPGAITGALVTEWLATGSGIGRAIIAAVAQAKMSEVWTLAAVITLVSIVLYMTVATIESAVLTRFGIERVEM